MNERDVDLARLGVGHRRLERSDELSPTTKEKHPARVRIQLMHRPHERAGPAHHMPLHAIGIVEAPSRTRRPRPLVYGENSVPVKEHVLRGVEHSLRLALSSEWNLGNAD